MIRTNPDGKCDFCDNDLAEWDYRYRGKHYCRRCYELNFRLKTCAVCGKRRRIHRDLKTPVCKICQVRDEPCIRCKRRISPDRTGMITEHGPVCTPCSKYFREPKRCPVCGRDALDVFNRKEGGRMCEKCHLKRLEPCVMCRRRRPTFARDGEGRSICGKCASPERECRQCGSPMPAGRGRICMECAFRNGLSRKLKFAMGALSGEMAAAFEAFAAWFEKKRGAEVASSRLLEYLPFFLDIGNMERGCGRLPSYRELAEALSVKTVWENRLAMEFLNDAGLVPKDRAAQEEIAERDMIGRYLRSFPSGTLFGRMLGEYHDMLDGKLSEGKTSIRSVRLALTPAKRFLEYCLYCGKERPDREALEGYLWIYPGQKSALTGFANFLKKKFGADLDISSIEKPRLKRPKYSRNYLKQRFITAMRDVAYRRNIGIDEFLRIAIGYLHQVDVPVGIGIGFALRSVKKSRLMFCGEKFFLPNELIRITICWAKGRPRRTRNAAEPE